MIPQGCVEVTSDSNIKVSEAKSSYAVFPNPGHIEHVKIRFDGCVVKNAVACDWLVAKQGIGTLAVELKGSDVDHALTQILAGLKYAAAQECLPKRLAGLVICSRYPRVDTKVQRMQQRAAREFKAPLHVKTRGDGIDFDDLFSF